MLPAVLRLIVLKLLTSPHQIELSFACFDYDAVVLTLQFLCHDVNVDDDDLLKDDDVKAVVCAKIESVVGYRYLTSIYLVYDSFLKMSLVDLRKMMPSPNIQRKILTCSLSN